MISRDCDGCSLQAPCAIRYRQVKVGEFVYCPSGERHLIDGGSNP